MTESASSFCACNGDEKRKQLYIAHRHVLTIDLANFGPCALVRSARTELNPTL